MASTLGVTRSGEGRRSFDTTDYLSSGGDSNTGAVRKSFSGSRPSTAAMMRETGRAQDSDPDVAEMAGAAPNTTTRGTWLRSSAGGARATTTLRQELANNLAREQQQRPEAQPPVAHSFNFDFSIPSSSSTARLVQQPHQSTSDAYRSASLRHPQEPLELSHDRALHALSRPPNDALHQHPDNQTLLASKRTPAQLESSDAVETHLHKRRQTLSDSDKPAPAADRQQQRSYHSPRRDGVVTSPRTRASVERRRRLSAAAAALQPLEPFKDHAHTRDSAFLTASSRQDATKDTTAPSTPAHAQHPQHPDRPAPAAPVHAAQSSATFAASRPGLSQGPGKLTETVVPLRPEQKRAPASYPLDGINTSTSYSKDLSRDQAIESIETPEEPQSIEETLGESTQSRRDLLPLKTVQRSMSDDKRSSFTRRPPVSYKPPVSSGSSTPNGGSASIPPIRGFRSSGSRRSLTLDMNLQSPRNFDNCDDYLDSNPRDRSLRALEGRSDEQTTVVTPPDSALADTDDSGDVFLRIARQEAPAHEEDNRRYGDTRSDVARLSRSARRPMSAAVNTYEPGSPPPLSRRMSEQETARSRDPSVDVGSERMSRQNTVTYRGLSRERATDGSRTRGPVTGLHSTPITPRTLTFQEGSNLPPDSLSPQTRRRQHSVDTSYAAGTRVNTLKQSGSVVGTGRGYNSSPLAPKTVDPQKIDTQQESGNTVEGTNSTTSTAAPSTVWDELDELKSRIHRLELTGKLPPTSGAAISRATEERPPTAHTNATTMSASPKRGVAQAQASDAVSTTSSSHHIQKESHPVLHNALAKSKPLLSAEVYAALEAAAKDALSLTNLMGASGQPGPISSAASGVGGGPVVTDRQLRRKADSICRSITELCIALSDGTGEAKAEPLPTSVSPDKSPITSPTVTRFTGFVGHSRGASTRVDRSAMLDATSPRAMSRVGEKRSSMLMGSALPSPRYNPPITASVEASPAGRKSSLLLSRTRRAQTEEPDDVRLQSMLRMRRVGTEEPEEALDRRTSLLVRGQRAGTEEPEEHASRKVSMLARARRKTMEADDEMAQLRTPSRAITEVAGFRLPREHVFQSPMPSRDDNVTLASSALPKRQLTTTSLGSRIVQPTPPSTMASRRFLERSTERGQSDRDVYFGLDRDEMPGRRSSLAQPSGHTRAGSLNRRTNRDSMIAVPTNSSGARPTSYR